MIFTGMDNRLDEERLKAIRTTLSERFGDALPIVENTGLRFDPVCKYCNGMSTLVEGTHCDQCGAMMVETAK